MFFQKKYLLPSITHIAPLNAHIDALGYTTMGEAGACEQFNEIDPALILTYIV